MKSTGIVRKVDNLGRIVLPIEMRRTLDIDIKDPVEIFAEEGRIVLKKHQYSCVFCGSTTNLTEFKDKKICEDCFSELKG